MKLLLNVMLILVSDLFGPLHGQNASNKAVASPVQEARFMVTNSRTNAPVSQAGLFDRTGKKLGETDAAGKLKLNLAASDKDIYSIRASGYNAAEVKLNNVSKKTGDYEVVLMESNRESGTDSNTSDPATDPNMVKVYVKQDPATYKKSEYPSAKDIEFAVQLSASSRPITDKSSLSSWEELGPVYIHTENGMYKVRIGPFDTQDKAKQVLLQAKARGKKDAFIVIQQGLEVYTDQGHPIHQANEAVMTSEEKVPEVKSQTPPKETSTNDSDILEYKVRLASYLKPGGFNTKDVDQYGPLESYRQGEWTIMLIGGFKTAKDAERVRDQVIAKGYKDAAVVVDRGGILESDY